MFGGLICGRKPFWNVTSTRSDKESIRDTKVPNLPDMATALPIALKKEDIFWFNVPMVTTCLDRCTLLAVIAISFFYLRGSMMNFMQSSCYPERLFSNPG